MGLKILRGLEGFTIAILTLVLLPSLTALSEFYEEAIPVLYRYTGPFNPFKFGLPFLVLFCILKIRKMSVIERASLRLPLWLSAIGVFIVSAGIAGKPCGYPPMYVRECWMILCGVLSGFAWVCLSEKSQKTVVWIWFSILLFVGLTDWLVPSINEWLYFNVFDPRTPKTDLDYMGKKVIGGIWGRQSMAKLSVWLPWLVVALMGWKGRSLKAWGIAGIGMVLSLGTTQRGPLLAWFVGAAAFAFVAWLRESEFKFNRKRILLILAGVLIVSIPIILSNSELLRDRWSTNDSDKSVLYRKFMMSLTFDQISLHPFGNACLTMLDYERYGVWAPGHAHHLFLQHLREWGWIWGTTHFILWTLALVGAWRNRERPGWFALMIVIWAGGMFDYPWTVLNHSVILGITLISMVKKRTENSTA